MSRRYRIRFRLIGGKGKRLGQSRASAGIEIGRSTELDRELRELQYMVLGATALAYASVNGAFREQLRNALVAEVTDPEDMALLPEFFPPSYPRIQ